MREWLLDGPDNETQGQRRERQQDQQETVDKAEDMVFVGQEDGTARGAIDQEGLLSSFN